MSRSIPKIRPYRIPALSEVPPNRVDWEVAPERCALLVHDMQQYFLEAFTSGEPPLSELLTNVAALRGLCAERAIPVFYSAQRGGQSRAERGLLYDFWGPGLDARPEMTRIAATVAPRDADTIVKKHRYSALHRTPLVKELRARGRTQLVICGVYAHIGCLATAIDAFMSDVQPFVVADAVADFTVEDHAMALAYVAQRCGVVTTTNAIARALARRPADGPSELHR